MRYLLGTQIIDLDWLFERIREDPAVEVKHVGTKEQVAHMLKKGCFSSQTWSNLCRLAQIGSPESLEWNHKPSKKKSGATPAMLRHHTAFAVRTEVFADTEETDEENLECRSNVSTGTSQ